MSFYTERITMKKQLLFALTALFAISGAQSFGKVQENMRQFAANVCEPQEQKALSALLGKLRSIMQKLEDPAIHDLEATLAGTQDQILAESKNPETDEIDLNLLGQHLMVLMQSDEFEPLNQLYKEIDELNTELGVYTGATRNPEDNNNRIMLRYVPFSNKIGIDLVVSQEVDSEDAITFMAFMTTIARTMSKNRE